MMAALQVIGSPEDVAGFALAGIDGIVCATRQEAREAIARVEEEALLLVSAEFARELPRGRLAVVLPGRS